MVTFYKAPPLGLWILYFIIIVFWGLTLQSGTEAGRARRVRAKDQDRDPDMSTTSEENVETCQAQSNVSMSGILHLHFLLYPGVAIEQNLTKR